MKRFDICALGNGILDILIQVDDDTFAGLGLVKATTTLVDAQYQSDLLGKLRSPKQVLASGGSAANSIIGATQLGARTAFTCLLGDDRYGLHYKNEFESLDIALTGQLAYGKPTGTCIVVITPDGERTMCTCLGVGGEITPADVDAEVIRDSQWLFVEGYLLAQNPDGTNAVREAVKIAKEAGTKIAITVSEVFIVSFFGDALREIVSQADLVFANVGEAMAFTGASEPVAAFERLKEAAPHVMMTAGSHGAYLKYNGVEVHVPAAPCDPVDLTGAGDMFAGAMLYALSQNMELKKAGEGACYLAMKVITQIGARLHSGTKEFWLQATGAV